MRHFLKNNYLIISFLKDAFSIFKMVLSRLIFLGVFSVNFKDSEKISQDIFEFVRFK